MKDQKRWSYDVTYASCASLYVCPSVYVVTKNEWQFVSFYLHFSVFDFSCLLLYLLFPLLLKINYILILEDSETHFRNRDFRFFLLIATLKTRFHSMRSFIFHGQLNIYTFWFINAIYGKIFSYLLWKIKSSRLLSWYSDSSFRYHFLRIYVNSIAQLHFKLHII